MTAVLWAASGVGLAASTMSALNICTDACSEAGLYGFMGIGLGWFGVAFFTTLIVLLLVRRFHWIEQVFAYLVFAAAGAELRFIWIQKYVIGKWCPLCLVIAGVVFFMVLAVLTNEWAIFRSRRNSMKFHAQKLAVFLLAAMVGMSGAVLGVRKEAEASELNMWLGKTSSSTVVYIVSDWFCPACRGTEPAIVEMFPKLGELAKVGFVDIPVHPETSNFTPYNTQFLVYEKGKYLQLREALTKLSLKTKTPSPEEVSQAIAPTGVKLRAMNYADIASGMAWNREVFETYEIKATPTVVVANEKTGKHVTLVGEKQISYRSVLKAMEEVGK